MESVADTLVALNSELVELSKKAPYKDSLRGLYSLVLAGEVLAKSKSVISDFKRFSGYNINLESAKKSLDYYLSGINEFKIVIEEFNPELTLIMDDYLNCKLADDVLITASIFDNLANKPAYANDSHLSFLADYKTNLDFYVGKNPISSLIDKKKKERITLFNSLIDAYGYTLTPVKRCNDFFIDVKWLVSDDVAIPHTHTISLGKEMAYVDLNCVDAQVSLKRVNDFWCCSLSEFFSWLSERCFD
ncbi:MAG TPA: hypothetical protein VI790_02260 [Candidatus Nanoarchaeia archaeon]|nr:hypothetical protein [Candidatus Nanoarchaeia archaeon]